ncbi:MAG: hypothetical protein Tsb0034_20880 [Ekhidna sp.]
MKHLFNLSIYLIFSHACIAQADNQGQQSLLQLGLRSDETNELGENDNVIVEGTPFLFDEFKNGWILLNQNQDTIGNVRIRLSLLGDILEWEKTPGQRLQLQLKPIEAFGIEKEGGSYQVFLNTTLFKDSELSGFVETIYTGGKASVFLKHKIEKDIKEPEPYGPTKTTITFRKSATAYILKSGQLARMKNKKEYKEITKKYGLKAEKIKSSDLEEPAFLQKFGAELDQ